MAVNETTVHRRAWLRKHLQPLNAMLHETVGRFGVATSRFASDIWLRCTCDRCRAA